jgi:hypothetical protein
MLRLMATRGSIALAGALLIGAMPYTTSSASAASCGYALQMSQGIVDGSGPRVPAGYEVAEQPSVSPWPAELAVFGVGLTATDKTNCRTSGVTVRFQSRDASQPSFLTRRTVSTDAQGTVGVDARPTRTGVVRAVATAPDGAALTSNVIVVRVRAYVSATYARLPGCGLAATGSTFPAKPNHPVNLEARVDGSYRSVATARADKHGVYRVRWTSGCGKHDLAVSVPASATNDMGRTLFVRLGVLAS